MIIKIATGIVFMGYLWVLRMVWLKFKRDFPNKKQPPKNEGA